MSVMDSIEEKYEQAIEHRDILIGELRDQIVFLVSGIEKRDKQIAALKTERDLLKKHQAICECGGLSIDHNISDNHQVSDMISPCPFKEQIAALKGDNEILRNMNQILKKSIVALRGEEVRCQHKKKEI